MRLTQAKWVGSAIEVRQDHPSALGYAVVDREHLRKITTEFVTGCNAQLHDVQRTIIDNARTTQKLTIRGRVGKYESMTDAQILSDRLTQDDYSFNVDLHNVNRIKHQRDHISSSVALLLKHGQSDEPLLVSVELLASLDRKHA